MAKPNLIKSLFSLCSKIDTLLEQRDKLQLKVEQLQKENSLLREELRDSKNIIAKTRQDVEFLSLSYRLASSPEALVSARKEISKLIRTIDSCIRLIKED